MTITPADTAAADIAELYAYPDKGRRVVDLSEVRAAVGEVNNDPDAPSGATRNTVRQILRARGYTIRTTR